MKLNVLLVDDSALMRKMVRQALAQAGFELERVEEATNGQEGLEKLQNILFDVALVDLHMPVMTGDEMFEKWRVDPKASRTPIVFVSSESSAARIVALLEKGAGFVHKPWSPEDLRSQILSVRGEHRGRV